MRFTMRSRFSTSFCLSAFTGVVAMILRPLPYRPLLDPFWLPRAQHNSFHINACQVNAIRVELPWFHDLFHFYYRDLRCRGHHRIEVACCLAENQVAPAVRLPCFDQGEVG